MKKFGSIILIIGISLFIKSINLALYNNEEEFYDKYKLLSEQKNRTEKYYELRQEYLSPKVTLQNYGITCIILGLFILLVSYIGIRKIKTPSKKIWIVLVGILAALETNRAIIGDLYLDMDRQVFPHWADSIGIFLITIPFTLLLSLIWVSFNLIGINKKDFNLNVKIFSLKLENFNYWYIIILLITILITIYNIITGYFWQIISGILWSYFYLSLLLGKDVKRNY